MLRQAVILVGGLGTRLGERTRATPKPMLDVAGRPFLDYLLDEISRYSSIESILLLAGYRAEQVAERYHGKRRRGARIEVAQEPAPLGTGGALQHSAAALQPRFLLLNGDSLFDFNMQALIAAGMSRSSLLHMALKRQQAGDRYGRVVIEGDRVTGFTAPGARATGPINAGIYVVDRGILDLIGNLPCSLENDVFPRLVAAGQVTGSLYDGYFIDIGVPQDLELASKEFARCLRRPAVFFDRDGVLNVDRGYVHRIEDFEWISGAREAVKLANDLGYLTFVVTNQAGVAHGHYGLDAIERLHGWMANELALVGAHIEAFQFCPFHENGKVEAYRAASPRRKPAPGMILDCLQAWPVEASESLLIGDKESDLAAAAAAGIAGHLFRGGSLLDFLQRLLKPRSSRD